MQAPATRRPAAGFTLVEMLCTLAVAGIVSILAVPGFRQALAHARRAEGVLAMLQLQLAEERHRADHIRYGSLADLRLPDRSTGGHYRLAVDPTHDDGFAAQAIAVGAQVADAACRRLALRVDGDQVVHASGRDERLDNDDAANRRCWGL